MATSAVARAPHQHNRRHHRNGNGAPRQRSADGQVFGVLLMVFGLGWFLRVSGAIEMDWESLVSVVLIVLGVGMAVTARARTGGLLLVLGILLTISLATTSSVGEVGDLAVHRRIAPNSMAEFELDYGFVIGLRKFDFTEVPLPAGETFKRIDMSAGEMVVTVPADLAVHIDADLGGGEIRLLDHERIEGGSVEDTYEDPEYDTADRRLRLVLSGGGGSIEVDRAPPRAPTETTAPPEQTEDADAPS